MLKKGKPESEVLTKEHSHIEQPSFPFTHTHAKPGCQRIIPTQGTQDSDSLEINLPPPDGKMGERIEWC